MTHVIEEKKDELAELCRRYHVRELDVFGSAATGEFDDENSDIDLLVEFDNSVGRDRFDNFFALLGELRKLFNRGVDLVEPGGLRNPYFIDSVEKTRRKIYGTS